MTVKPPLDDIVCALDVSSKITLKLVAQIVELDGCVGIKVIEDVVVILKTGKYMMKAG